jgi:phage terminase large subunit
VSTEITLQPKQAALLDLLDSSKASWIGYGGSRGGGKSAAARRVMLIRRIEHPGTWGVIFRRTFDDLKKNHIDKFFIDFPELLPYYNATDHEVVIPSSNDAAPSKILFMYAENVADIRRKFFGPEFMDIMVDQGEQLTEEEMRLMKICCRWPGVPDYQCKFVLFFNPGGIGLQYLKRVFADKKYMGKEREEDYAFIQAFSWDNVEWVREALTDDGLTDTDFYGWEDSQRRAYVVTRSQYGRDLDSLPPHLRIGHLEGSLGVFAGQYYGAVYDRDKAVQSRDSLLALIKPWWPKWISIDWGFQHHTAVLWHTRGDVTADELQAVTGLVSKTSPVKLIITYRQKAVQQMSESALGEEIASLTPPDERAMMKYIFISPDAKQKRGVGRTVMEQVGDALHRNGMPRPQSADDDRVGGWRLMYNQLQETNDCALAA